MSVVGDLTCLQSMLKTINHRGPVLKYALNSDQVIITPHIGGMTREAQEIAYNHAASILKNT